MHIVTLVVPHDGKSKGGEAEVGNGLKKYKEVEKVIKVI